MADTSSEDLKQKISRQIDAAKEKLDMLKREIAGMRQEDLATLRQRQSDIRARLDQQKARAEELRAKIASWADEKRQHTIDAIASWRQRQELEKLQRRAARAEDYAVDMVTVAANDFEEAEQAVFEAIAARLEADQAIAPA
jgi:chromosome segregation ATPase